MLLTSWMRRRSTGGRLGRPLPRIDSAWRAVRPNVHVAIMATQSEIAAILRADQRARYDRWVRNMHVEMQDQQ